MKILVIDDDPDILTVAECALAIDSSITAKCLSTGKNAIDEIKAFKPDIVLLDVMMPELDGLAVLKMIRETESIKATPVILFTAKSVRQDAEFYKENGAQGIIPKPFNPITLAANVKQIWETIEPKV
jgi:two-component system OmpR family response regulator